MMNTIRTAGPTALPTLLVTGPLYPLDLPTAAASGLDLHLSVRATLGRVSPAGGTHGFAVDRVRAVVFEHLEGRALGFLGEPLVNVFRLSQAMDRQDGEPPEKPLGKRTLLG